MAEELHELKNEVTRLRKEVDWLEKTVDWLAEDLEDRFAKKVHTGVAVGLGLLVVFWAISMVTNDLLGLVSDGPRSLLIIASSLFMVGSIVAFSSSSGKDMPGKPTST